MLPCVSLAQRQKAVPSTSPATSAADPSAQGRKSREALEETPCPAAEEEEESPATSALQEEENRRREDLQQKQAEKEMQEALDEEEAESLYKQISDAQQATNELIEAVGTDSAALSW